VGVQLLSAVSEVGPESPVNHTDNGLGEQKIEKLEKIYPAHAMIRNFVGFMIRKLSVTSSQ
jgi:hypothetical protein